MRRTRTLAFISVGILVCLCVPALWNLVVVHWYRSTSTVPGVFFDVDGREMHILCTGSGGPTVLLEHAASASYLLWRRVQPGLSRVTRVCSYDRPGHGWSPMRDEPRDAQTVAHELHTLLDQAGVPKPFIYVAHSAGGLYVREYAREYPRDLAGVALIDASSPHQIDELPGWREGWNEDLKERDHDLWRDRLKTWSGWYRLTGACHVDLSNEDRSFSGLYQGMMCRPGYVDTDESEEPFWDVSSKQAGRLTSFGAIPLLVVSEDPAKFSQSEEEKHLWSKEQEEATRLSPESWRVVAKGSGHMVPLDRPDLVLKELTLLVDVVRGKQKPKFGTTAVE